MATGIKGITMKMVERAKAFVHKVNTLDEYLNLGKICHMASQKFGKDNNAKGEWFKKMDLDDIPSPLRSKAAWLYRMQDIIIVMYEDGKLPERGTAASVFTKWSAYCKTEGLDPKTGEKLPDANVPEDKDKDKDKDKDTNPGIVPADLFAALEVAAANVIDYSRENVLTEQQETIFADVKTALAMAFKDYKTAQKTAQKAA